MVPLRGMRPVGGGAPPFQSGVNATGGNAPPKPVGWQNKGNRNPTGFGGPRSTPGDAPPIANPDSGGGTSINMRSPRVASGVVGPPPGGSQMKMAGGFNALM